MRLDMGVVDEVVPSYTVTNLSSIPTPPGLKRSGSFSLGTPKALKTSSPIQVSLSNIQQQVRRHHSDKRTRYWINSVQADCVFAAAIAAHSLIIGCDVQIALMQVSNRDAFFVLEVGMMGVRGVLNLVFTLELFLRAMAWGRSYVLNLNGFFDIFLVLTAWTDIALVLSGVALTEQVSATMYACRLLRLVRIFRIFAIVPALRLIVAGLATTIAASLWTVMLLLLCCYVGALLCTDLLAADVPDLYGSIALSIFTHVKLALVEAWPDLAAPMMEQSRLWGFYVTVFMLICNMALLNVVTGLICEKVLLVASKAPPPCLQEREELEKAWKTRLKRMFETEDEDHNGVLNEAEYSHLLKTRDGQELLKEMSVGLPLDHYSLLNVLDQDCNGVLTCDELLDGLTRQRGTRSDHLSQTLQCDLAQRTNQIMKATEEFSIKTKSASRQSMKSVKKRLAAELKGPAVDVQGKLQSLEEASSELLLRVRGLKTTCAAAQAVEDIVPISQRCDSPIKVKHAGTGSVGDHSSRNSSCSSSCHDFGNPGEATANDGDVQSFKCSGQSVASSSSNSSSGSSGAGRGSRSSCKSEAESDEGESTPHSGDSSSLCRSTLACYGSVGSPTFGSLGPFSGITRGSVGTLHVQVLGLHGLLSSGEFMFGGTFDTYVDLRIGSLRTRTPTVMYSRGAAWTFGEPTLFTLGQPLQVITTNPPALEAEVMNAWLVSHDSLGVATIDLEGLSTGRWHRRRHRLGGRQGGELELAIRWEAFGQAEETEVDVISTVQGGVDVRSPLEPNRGLKDLQILRTPGDDRQVSLDLVS